MTLFKHWRYLLVALLAGGALAAFSACGDDDEEQATETPAATTPAAGERIQGGALTIQYVQPQKIDPHFSSFAQDIGFERMVWRGLYSLDIDKLPFPALAGGGGGGDARG